MRKFGTKDDVEGLRPCRKTAGAHAKRIYEPFEVETIEGTMTGLAGDYLMRGVEGELYPCAASVFHSSYAWGASEPPGGGRMTGSVQLRGVYDGPFGDASEADRLTTGIDGLAIQLADVTRERDVAQGQANAIRREFGAVETWPFPWDKPKHVPGSA